MLLQILLLIFDILEFDKINLEENWEFINEHYRIYLKNFGNRIAVELRRYDPIGTVENLNNETKKLSEEKSNLEKETKKLSEEGIQLKNETKELIEKNKSLKNKINEYKNRKDVKTVNKMKKVLKK